MEALVPAFVAALLAGAGERSARLAAALADRYGRLAVPLAGLFAVHAAVLALAAAGGALVSPLLNPNARMLLVALALGFAGIAGLSRIGAARATAESREKTGSIPLAMAQAALADSTVFIAFALAVRGPSATLAGAGVLAGTMALAVIAATMGISGWRAMPMRLIDGVAGALLLGSGVIMAAGAFRMI